MPFDKKTYQRDLQARLRRKGKLLDALFQITKNLLEIPGYKLTNADADAYNEAEKLCQ
jgi:hypothetical protein